MSKFSLEQVSKLLSVTDGRLRYWQKLGLFPRRDDYDWNDLQKAKLLNRLVGEGVPATHLVPHAPVLEGNEFHAFSRALVVDDEFGAREVESGQFLFEFQEPNQSEVRPLQILPQSEEWERQAHEALQAGDSGKALELAKGALEANPIDVASLNNLGLLFLDLEETELALESLRRACNSIEAGARQWFNLAHALEVAGDPQAAVEALEQSLILDPDFSAGRFNLAYTCEALGLTGRAYLHWKAYLERHPQSDDAEKIKLHIQTTYGGGQVIPLRSIK